MCKTGGGGGRFYYNATCCNLYNFTFNVCIFYTFVVMHKAWREGGFYYNAPGTRACAGGRVGRGN